MFRFFASVVVAVTCMVAAGCQLPPPGSAGRLDERVTVGKVQREIRVGMSGAEVVEVLGSPNVVSTDEERREVWVYDKISTERAYTTSGGVGTILILSAGGESGRSSSSQRTLTIIIKFDKSSKVRDFSYHSSRF